MTDPDIERVAAWDGLPQDYPHTRQLSIEPRKEKYEANQTVAFSLVEGAQKAQGDSGSARRVLVLVQPRPNAPLSRQRGSDKEQLYQR